MEEVTKTSLFILIFTVKDVYDSDSYTSMNRLPEKSDKYGLMHVKAEKIAKTAFIILISKTLDTYLSVFLVPVLGF